MLRRLFDQDFHFGSHIQAHQVPLQLIWGDARFRCYFIVCKLLLLVEQEQDDHLQSGDIQLVSRPSEYRLQVCSTMLKLPGQSAASVFLQVEGLKPVAALLKFLRQITRNGGGIGPKARGQHIDTENYGGASVRWVSSVCLHQIFRQLNVLKHSLEFRGVQVSTFTFQLRYHQFLAVVGQTAIREKSPCQMQLVEIFENIFVLQKSENGDCVLQVSIDFLLSHPLDSFAEEFIDKESQILGSTRILV
mmetsp:Transcript_38140/g.99857  ORF Transcript_38140/g.99857 Transcript_38140/m.99857 type:complete len:247 (-) Transcript_38140:1103-1843(-)